MSYLVACCSHCGETICFVGMEDHSAYAGFVFCILIVEHFSLLAIDGVCHEVCHGG
jgi:hypothetical protein